VQGRSRVARNLLRGGKRGDLGTQKRGSGDGCPPAGSRGRAPVGVWGKAPRSRRHAEYSTKQNAQKFNTAKIVYFEKNSSYDGGTCTHAPLGYATVSENVSNSLTSLLKTFSEQRVVITLM